MKVIRIILAEDHPLMRVGTRRILERHPDLEVVGEAENGEQAIHLIKNLEPDIAILDVRMPKLSGIEVVRQIKHLSSETKALMLSAYDDDEYVLALMVAGASGYLLKTAREKELIDSVRDIYSGEQVLHPAIAMKVARLCAQGSIYTQQPYYEQLSPREMEVLELASKGLQNKTIADSLNISHRTVEAHFNKIFSKFEVSSRVEAIVEAVTRNLISLKEDTNK